MEELLDKARSSIAQYCMHECNAYCCRKGYIELKIEDRQLFGADKVLDLSKNCPFLDGSKCTIHENPLRPRACREFPIFLLAGNRVRFSSRCPAVRDNKFYELMHEIRKRGYLIV